MCIFLIFILNYQCIFFPIQSLSCKMKYLTQNVFLQDLRDAFVFKIVPMLNPDGVIVGNYRCSLAARDLNRNYRHPRKTSFPTIWHTKALMEEFSQEHEVRSMALYIWEISQCLTNF